MFSVLRMYWSDSPPNGIKEFCSLWAEAFLVRVMFGDAGSHGDDEVSMLGA